MYDYNNTGWLKARSPLTDHSIKYLILTFFRMWHTLIFTIEKKFAKWYPRKKKVPRKLKTRNLIPSPTYFATSSLKTSRNIFCKYLFGTVFLNEEAVEKKKIWTELCSCKVTITNADNVFDLILILIFYLIFMFLLILNFAKN